MPTKKTGTTQNGTTSRGTSTRGTATRERRPSEQVLQVVDRTVGAVPMVADAVRSAVGELSDPQRLNAELERAEARGADVRRQVTDQVVERARKARERVEPVYKPRVERVESVYRQRFEPTVRKVRERI
jgi:hypothetical protein